MCVHDRSAVLMELIAAAFIGWQPEEGTRRPPESCDENGGAGDGSLKASGAAG